MKGGYRVAEIVVVQDLVKQYGSISALSGVSFAVEGGECFGLLGPNGAGKSTLIRILSTLERASSGTVTIQGRDLLRQAGAVRRDIGVALQETGVDPLMTGEETLRLTARLYGLAGASLKKRTESLIERFHLQDVCRRPVRTYSGGMRRRLDLAAALVHDPAVIILDEPTTGLDPLNRQTLWNLLATLTQEDGKTLLLTTQYLDEADALCGRVLFLNQGQAVATGTPDDLKREMGYSVIRCTIEDADEMAVLDALSHQGFDASRDRQRLSVLSEEPEVDVRHVDEIIRSLGGHMRYLEVQPPSLDDVFHHLTASESDTGRSVSHAVHA
jgi:ABC-2 type transport system ATP-binding protein